MSPCERKIFIVSRRLVVFLAKRGASRANDTRVDRDLVMKAIIQVLPLCWPLRLHRLRNEIKSYSSFRSLGAWPELSIRTFTTYIHASSLVGTPTPCVGATSVDRLIALEREKTPLRFRISETEALGTLSTKHDDASSATRWTGKLPSNLSCPPSFHRAPRETCVQGLSRHKDAIDNLFFPRKRKQ